MLGLFLVHPGVVFTGSISLHFHLLKTSSQLINFSLHLGLSITSKASEFILEHLDSLLAILHSVSQLSSLVLGVSERFLLELSLFLNILLVEFVESGLVSLAIPLELLVFEEETVDFL